ncbi:MAG: hypothetical protein K2K80_06815 [Clostridia bacterium]|nr:hypothetical protein [Clostridia bacterium]
MKTRWGAVGRAVKLTILSIIAIALLACVCVLHNRLCFDGGENYTFYCGTSSKDCKVVTAQYSAAAERLLLKNVCGESIEADFHGLESILEKYDGKVVFEEEFSDGVNYYCSANLPYSVYLNGQEINLHVCVRGDRAKIGSPIIFGGY